MHAAKEKYVWILATIQFSFVVLFSHVFYSRIYVISHLDSSFFFSSDIVKSFGSHKFSTTGMQVKQPVSCIVLATMVGFGLTMSGTTVITMFIEWRRSHAHHQPTSTHVATPPFQTIE